MNDRYCPNCRQMVQPKRSQKIIEFVTSIIVWLVVVPALLPYFGLGDWIGQWWLTTVEWAAILASAIVALPVIRSCPLCKSCSLEEYAPTA